MDLWGPLQCVLIDGLQMSPEERGLELGKGGILFESAVPYRRSQISGHKREGEEDEIRNHGVWLAQISVDGRIGEYGTAVAAIKLKDGNNKCFRLVALTLTR